MLKKPLTYFLFISGLILSTACTNNEAQNKFEAQAYSEPSGYTETDLHQDIVQLDSDDWRVSPLYLGLVQIEPLYPNPVEYGSTANLDIYFRGSTISSILDLHYIPKSGGNPIPIQTLDVNDDWDTVSFTIDTRQFGSTPNQAQGLYRLLVFDGNLRMVTYGDILIQ